MQPEIVVTEIGLDAHQYLTASELERLLSGVSPARRTRRAKKYTVIDTTEIVAEEPSPQPVPPAQPEAPKDPLEAAGFNLQMKRLFEHFEGLKENQSLPAITMQLMKQLEETTLVDAFDTYNEEELKQFLRTLRERLPRIRNEVNQFSDLMRKVKVVATEVEFI